MKKIKLTVAAVCIAMIGLLSFKENKVVKADAYNNTIKQIVPTDGRYYDGLDEIAQDSTRKKKKKRTDTLSMPMDSMPNKKPMDSTKLKK